MLDINLENREYGNIQKTKTKTKTNKGKQRKTKENKGKQMEPIIERDYFVKVTTYWTKYYSVIPSNFDDIVSESYLKYYVCCLKNKINSNDIQTHKKYVSSIVKNKCVDYKRDEYKTTELNDNTTKNSNEAITEAVVLDVIDKVNMINNILSKDKSNVLYLRYIEQLSFKEIAESLNANKSAIKSKHNRLLRRLKCK